jgi:hypothetical protein
MRIGVLKNDKTSLDNWGLEIVRRISIDKDRFIIDTSFKYK